MYDLWTTTSTSINSIECLIFLLAFNFFVVNQRRFLLRIACCSSASSRELIGSCKGTLPQHCQHQASDDAETQNTDPHNLGLHNAYWSSLIWGNLYYRLLISIREIAKFCSLTKQEQCTYSDTVAVCTLKVGVDHEGSERTSFKSYVIINDPPLLNTSQPFLASGVHKLQVMNFF